MKPTIAQDRMATFFTALGHRRRQMLCAMLAQVGPKGICYGSLQSRSGLTRATLSHHLGFMEKGGILKRQVKGRETWFALDFSALEQGTDMFAHHLKRKRIHCASPLPPAHVSP